MNYLRYLGERLGHELGMTAATVRLSDRPLGLHMHTCCIPSSALQHVLLPLQESI